MLTQLGGEGALSRFVRSSRPEELSSGAAASLAALGYEVVHASLNLSSALLPAAQQQHTRRYRRRRDARRRGAHQRRRGRDAADASRFAAWRLVVCRLAAAAVDGPRSRHANAPAAARG